VLNSGWLSDSILNGDWLYFHGLRMLYAKLIGRIALFTCENIAHIEFYLQGLLPKILAIYTIKTFSERVFCKHYERSIYERASSVNLSRIKLFSTGLKDLTTWAINS